MSISQAFRFLITGIGLISGLSVADEVRVPGDYDTIQEAINTLEDGPDPTRTILVAPGTYEENLRLRSNIELRGEETARTILKPADTEQPTVLVTTTADVTVRNFTFTDTPVAVEINDSSNVLIASDVFAVGSEGIALRVPVASTVNVVNNTFRGNEAAIERVNDAVEIVNNLFSENTLAIDTDVAGNIRFNCFANNTNNGELGSSSVTGDDALFVDSGALDFHLREGSPCIDQGEGQDVIDETDADRGAYGGDYADPLPFPVQNVETSNASDAVGTPSIDISWSRNNSYLVAGYKVYYDSDESGAPYDGTDGAGGTAASPIDVGDNVSYRLADLSLAGTPPQAPTLTAITPGDGQLVAQWTEVSGATGYVLRYGQATLNETVELGKVTEHTLSGLANGVRYQVAVAARLQPTYYIAVRAYDSTGNDAHLSAYSEEAHIELGEARVSDDSNVGSAIAEPVQAYPALPNEGCFIATAAYGHYSAPQVQALRDFRDRYLLPHGPGRALVAWYYTHSPPWAQYIAANPDARAVARWLLWPLVMLSMLLTQSNPALIAAAALLLGAVALGIARRYRARRRSIP